MKRRTRTSLGPLFLMLTVFAGFIGYFILFKPLQAARATQDWGETDAVILTSKLATVPYHKGGNLYRLDVSYRYEWQGKNYTGCRYSPTDNASRDSAGKAAALQRLAPGATVTCYVNPAAPGEAVLSLATQPHRLAWLIVGGVLVLSLTGLVWAIGGYFAKPPPLVGELWRTRADWASGRIQAKPTTTASASWVLAVAFVFFGGVVAVVGTKQHIPYPQGLIIWLFPAAGVGLSIWGGRNFARWRRFHKAVLELSSVPAPVGGLLAGTIRLQQLTHADAGFRLRLRCYRRGSDNKEYVLWQTDQAIPGGFVDQVPVAIAIPADAQPTTSDGDGGWSIFWRLEADTGTAASDGVAGFEVPVMGGAAGTQPAPAPTLGNVIAALTARIQSPPALPVTPGPVALPAHSRFNATTAADGRRVISIGPLRGGWAVGMPVLAIGWGLLTRFLWTLHDVPWPIRIVFTFFAVVLVVATVSGLGGWSRLTAGPTGLSIAHNLFRGGRRRHLSAGDIAGFQKSFAGNAQIQEVRARLQDGRTIRLIGNIRDPLEADWLIAELTTALGLPK